MHKTHISNNTEQSIWYLPFKHLKYFHRFFQPILFLVVHYKSNEIWAADGNNIICILIQYKNHQTILLLHFYIFLQRISLFWWWKFWWRKKLLASIIIYSCVYHIGSWHVWMLLKCFDGIKCLILLKVCKICKKDASLL